MAEAAAAAAAVRAHQHQHQHTTTTPTCNKLAQLTARRAPVDSPLKHCSATLGCAPGWRTSSMTFSVRLSGCSCASLVQGSLVSQCGITLPARVPTQAALPPHHRHRYSHRIATHRAPCARGEPPEALLGHAWLCAWLAHLVLNRTHAEGWAQPAHARQLNGTACKQQK